jgi:N-acylneuraminate cytidylyltransferase
VRALAIIPARGGSKGVPRKNLRLVGGRPLVAWSIEAALAAPSVDRVVVSSDDPEILRVARIYGASAQERPAQLSTDEALTDPVLVHVVGAMGGYRPDAVVLLQPTVPVRRPGLVEDCIQALRAATLADAVLTAYPLHFVHWRENSDSDRTEGRGRWRTQCPRRPRRQDMHDRELMFHEDGSVYVTRTGVLLATGSRFGRAYEVIETERTVDIDTEVDLLIADAMLQQRDPDLPAEVFAC